MGAVHRSRLSRGERDARTLHEWLRLQRERPRMRSSGGDKGRMWSRTAATQEAAGARLKPESRVRRPGQVETPGWPSHTDAARAVSSSSMRQRAAVPTGETRSARRAIVSRGAERAIAARRKDGVLAGTRISIGSRRPNKIGGESAEMPSGRRSRKSRSAAVPGVEVDGQMVAGRVQTDNADFDRRERSVSGKNGTRPVRWTRDGKPGGRTPNR